MVEAEACGGVVVAVEEAAGIICSLRAGDLAGWTPPWRSTPAPSVAGEGATTKEEEKAWPAVTRGKRSRSSRRRSPSGSGSAAKGRWARGSPASPLDYSVGSGSGASTSGGEDGAFCSPPAPAVARAHAGPAAVQPSPSAKVGLVGARRPSTLPVPVPVPPPRPAGQRSRKKMRLPEVQLLVQSLAAENDGLRQEMQSLRRACMALSKENGTLETRLEHSSSSKRTRTESEEEQQQQQQQGKPNVAERSTTTNGFVLPDLNIPAQDVADGPVVAAP